MAFVFHRRLAVPLWVLASFAFALTVPASAPRSLLVILAIVMLAFTMPGAIPFLRGSSSAARIRPNGQRRRRCAATVLVAGADVRTFDAPNLSTAEDALDLVRMDDDGGWQMARPQV